MKRTGKTIIIIFFLFLLNGCYTTFSRVDVISGENYEEKNSEKWSNLFSSLLSSGLPFSLSIGFSRSNLYYPYFHSPYYSGLQYTSGYYFGGYSDQFNFYNGHHGGYNGGESGSRPVKFAPPGFTTRARYLPRRRKNSTGAQKLSGHYNSPGDKKLKRDGGKKPRVIRENRLNKSSDTLPVFRHSNNLLADKGKTTLPRKKKSIKVHHTAGKSFTKGHKSGSRKNNPPVKTGKSKKTIRRKRKGRCSINLQ